jgi:hypothetical protein
MDHPLIGPRRQPKPDHIYAPMVCGLVHVACHFSNRDVALQEPSYRGTRHLRGKVSVSTGLPFEMRARSRLRRNDPRSRRSASRAGRALECPCRRRVQHTRARACDRDPDMERTGCNRTGRGTTALSILSRLVRKAMLASNVSAAVVFRAIDRHRPALLMDEADTYLEQRGDEFYGILNSGHTRDAAVVWRTVGDKYEPKAFSTWAPMVIAAIGKLRPTLASRSIIIVMRRKRADESVTRYRANRDGPLLDELARKCARWAKDNLQNLKGADPMMPKQLNNRAADNWRPLLAIADVIGGDCPSRARRAALLLTGDEIEVTPGEQALAHIRKVFAQGGIDRISSKELCQELGRIEGGLVVTQGWLAAMLRPFGIRPHTIRIGSSTPKGYELKDFEDAFARYLPKNDATSEEN